MNYFMTDKDIQMIREIKEISLEDLAEELGVSLATVKRWEKNEVEISDVNMEKLYSYAYKNRIYINKIKEQLYREEYYSDNCATLYHGAKSILDGAIDVEHARANNDFGKGFYCGETLEQSAMFVSSYDKSCVYALAFDKTDLKGMKFNVDQDWMLTIAYFRGKLDGYQHTEKIEKLIKKLEGVDYIVAPIADNRMFQIIDSFIEGEITDEQCKHCLSATNLGFQYVFKTPQAVSQITVLERCYLCQYEKDMYANRRRDESKISEDKVKIARRQYRGKGLYIEEILV